MNTFGLFPDSGGGYWTETRKVRLEGIMKNEVDWKGAWDGHKWCGQLTAQAEPGKGLSPHKWRPFVQEGSIHSIWLFRVFPVDIPEESRKMTLGEYVVHVRMLDLPHYWKDALWKLNRMQLNFSNVGNKKIFISNDHLFPETFGSNNE